MRLVNLELDSNPPLGLRYLVPLGEKLVPLCLHLDHQG